MSNDAIKTEIITKVSKWKTHFKRAVEARGGGPLPENVDDLTYAQILTGAGGRITLPDLHDSIRQAIETIGVFSSAAKNRLHSFGYLGCRQVSGDIFRGFDNKNFGLQIKDGPVIAVLENDQRLGIVFHRTSAGLKMLEMYYESDDAALFELPDTFIEDIGGISSVKAVQKLSDDQRLAKRIDQLGLSSN